MGRWRLMLKLGSLFVTFSNAPLKFQSINTVLMGDGKDRIKLRLLAERGNRCEHCGRPATESKLELHHIQPISLRPDLRKDPDNLLLLCQECHRRAHGYIPQPLALPTHEA